MGPRREYSSAATADDATSTEGLDFAIDGVVFICHGRISAFDLAEFSAVAMDAGPDMADAGVMRILADFMRGVLGPGTYEAVTRHRRKHQTPDEVMQQILQDLIEDAAARPTTRQSPSPAGPPPPPSPPAASPSPAGTGPAPAARRQIPAALAAMLGEDGEIKFADPPETAPAGPPVPPPGRRVVSLAAN